VNLVVLNENSIITGIDNIINIS